MSSEPPTPAQIAHALADLLAAHPGLPALVWTIHPDGGTWSEEHLVGRYDRPPESATDRQATDRIAAVRAWATALGVPAEVTGTHLATVQARATLPGGARVFIGETVYRFQIPADLTGSPADLPAPPPF
ncbi:hypothetical protein ABZ249_25505 [Nocardiopsis sp. NPDC006139]|uniref:hypothetical protein n=1 Tax=Nocardiopsis sp. NPDC006139 TaxID=3154578 RepID=UPI00339FCC29